MTDYKIYKYQYFNEVGEQLSKYFYIKYQVKFLWWTYWKDVKHTDCGYGDCYKTRTKFKSEEEANKFIQDILCKGMSRDASKETEVKTVNCK